MNKKGMGLGALYPAVLTIVIVGIALGVGIYTLTEVQEGISQDTISVVNESITMTNASGGGSSVAKVGLCQARNFSLTTLRNASADTVPATNYTFTDAGKLSVLDGSVFQALKANISYSYTGTPNTASTGACEVVKTSWQGVGGFASWVSVIVVVLAAAVVLGIVITSFARRKPGV